MSKTGLFDEFPEVSAKQWQEKIQSNLQGADYAQTLVWQSPEGIAVQPFYTAEDLPATKTPDLPKDHSWKIAEVLPATPPHKANLQARESLKKGAESLVFTLPQAQTDVAALLSQIDGENTALHFDLQFLERNATKKLLSCLESKKATARLYIDIIGNLARRGRWFYSLEKDHALLEEIYALAARQAHIPVIAVDVSLYQNAGATMVQQLAYALAQAHHYLHHYGLGKPLSISFKVAVGSNYFFEIAKLRALRRLWKDLSHRCKSTGDCHLVAFPTRRNKTLYDAHVNLLRTTTECMSALLGGADTVYNLPYDALFRKPNAFSQRLARNQLVLLKEESHLAQASQMVQGAYYIESLTQQLVEKAGHHFEQIKEAGGLLKVLQRGTLQQEVHTSASKEQQLFDEGTLMLVGTNAYLNPEDPLKDYKEDALAQNPFATKQAGKTEIVPIIEKRLAEALEQEKIRFNSGGD